MDFMLRRPPAERPESKGFAEEAKDGESVFPLVRMVEAYDPASDTRERFLSDEEFQVFADTFARTGFTGGINWYRNFTRNWERSAEVPTHITGIPCLMVTAENDAVLPPSAAEGMGSFIDDLRVVMVSDSGHWTQQEQPEQLNTLLCGG
jgi:pimeloyl-ACP methyl ester carboxylesterase